eukprot:3940732-Rhodomonas_salina.2
MLAPLLFSEAALTQTAVSGRSHRRAPRDRGLRTPPCVCPMSGTPQPLYAYMRCAGLTSRWLPALPDLDLSALSSIVGGQGFEPPPALLEVAFAISLSAAKAVPRQRNQTQKRVFVPSLFDSADVCT